MKFFKSRNAEHSNTSTAVPSNNNSMELPNDNTEKGGIAAVGKIPGLTLRTTFMAMLVAMGGFIFGYDTGQISGFLQMSVFLERFGQPTAVTTEAPSGYMFTNVRSGLIVALLSIGTLIGCLIAGPLANKFGRKWCIPPWCLVFCVGVVIQMAMGPGEWVGIVVGRWVAGLGVGALSVLVPLYMSET